MKYIVVLSRQVYETAIVRVEAESAEQAADSAVEESAAAHFSAPGASPPFRNGITVESATVDP